MKKIISIIFVLVIFLFSCNHVEYYEKSGWNCTQEKFQTYYYDTYTAKIEKLKSLYEIECHKEESTFQNGYYIYLYNDDFTIVIRFANEESLAYYDVNLYYYGASDSSRENYEKQRPLVNFINDFTNYVAFDTKNDKNYFEELYSECVKAKKDPIVMYSYQYDSVASYKYHYDSIVGNIGYDVTLNTNAHGYYYKMQKDSTYMAFCNLYCFKGLLKPKFTSLD